MSEIVRVELPFQKALVRAARQNFNKDVRLGKAHEVEWFDVQHEYLSEARALLLRDGENFKPTYPDVEHIVLSPSVKRS